MNTVKKKVKLIVNRILPNTRIALFKGCGERRDFTDDDILFHNTNESGLICTYQKEIEKELVFLMNTVKNNYVF